MTIFDGPDTGASTGSRVTSTTTLQALYFLNDPFLHEQSNRLSTRLISSRGDDPSRIKLAYELCFSRDPTDEELSLGKQYLTKNPPESTAWQSYIRALLRTNEFVYVDC